jgi:hypothetical protein
MLGCGGGGGTTNADGSPAPTAHSTPGSPHQSPAASRPAPQPSPLPTIHAKDTKVNPATKRNPAELLLSVSWHAVSSQGVTIKRTFDGKDQPVIPSTDQSGTRSWDFTSTGGFMSVSVEAKGSTVRLDAYLDCVIYRLQNEQGGGPIVHAVTPNGNGSATCQLLGLVAG